MPTDTPSSVANMDPNFEGQLRTLRTQAQQEAQSRQQGQPTPWMMPERKAWSGDLFDSAGMHSPFDRTQANQDFVKAVSDATKPGVVGDLIATTTQVDYLATMERAFRMRHTMRRPRAVLLAAGRKTGHGDPQGTLTQCGVEYLRGILKESKGS